MLTTQLIKERLCNLKLPFLETDVCFTNVLKNINIQPDRLVIELNFGYPMAVYQQKITGLIHQAIDDLLDNRTLEIKLMSQIRAHAVQPNLKPIAEVKNVIAIASGKGGVGKSTTAVNLALALSQLGANVGILDADIYGPNQPHMLGITKKPIPRADKKFQPILAFGVQSMSIGYLVDTTTPMVWRGPMVSGALQQLWRDTLWSNLDYLLIDLPPGTGDIQLTLAQKIPVTCAVIVTTPQDIALLDARKGLEMFRKVNVPVLGIIENMSTHICSQCGHEESIFGEQGASHLAAACDVPLLGQLPLELAIREAADRGCPSVMANADSAIAKQYRQIALTIAVKLASQPVDYSAKFPEVVVE